MAQILKLLVVPKALTAEIIAEARRLASNHEAPPEQRDAAHEAYLQQLKMAFGAGILTKTEYNRNLKEAQNRIGQPPIGVAFNMQRALGLISDVPSLFELASPQERLALVKSLFDRLVVEDRRITELMPRADVGPVLAALVRVLDGVPDGD